MKTKFPNVFVDVNLNHVIYTLSHNNSCASDSSSCSTSGISSSSNNQWWNKYSDLLLK